MGYVYRYTDAEDGIIKYVGIVWSDNRTLKQRIKEHEREPIFQGYKWIIEYIDTEVETRTDAEYLEAHYISLYETYKYLNSTKNGWGISKYIPERLDWKVYDIEKDILYDEIIYKKNEKLQKENKRLNKEIDYLEKEIERYQQTINNQEYMFRQFANTVEEASRELKEEIVGLKSRNSYLVEQIKIIREQKYDPNNYNIAFTKSLKEAELATTHLKNRNTSKSPCKATLFIGNKKVEHRTFDSISQLSQTLNIYYNEVTKAINDFNARKFHYRLYYDPVRNGWYTKEKRELLPDELNVRISRVYKKI